MKWFTTEELNKRGKIPDYFLDKIPTTCKCGMPIMHNEALTAMRCLNSDCVYHMAYRAKKLLKYIGIKGYGAKTCLDLIRAYQLKSHFEILPIVIGNQKPKIYLWEIVKLACIDGYSDTAEDIFSGYSNFEEFFTKALNIPSILLAYKDRLISYEKYFELKKTLSSDCIKIAIHEHIPGYANKKDYVEALNSICGQYVRIVLRGNAQSNDALVTMFPNSSCSKVATAKKVGMPIFSPTEFENYIVDYLKAKKAAGQLNLNDYNED